MEETTALIEEGARLVIEARQLVSEIESLLDEQKNESEINKYRNLLSDMRKDNERLFRENMLLKSRLESGDIESE